MTVIDYPSPNFDERERAISLLVLHYTGMPNGQQAIDWLCNPASRVSSHYAVEEDGRIFRLVAEEKRAWHAGVSFWRGETGLNNSSIGIEIVNPGHEWGYRKFPKVQMEAVISLCQDIVARHHIRPENVIGHSDIAPSRKIDPGELFDWHKLSKAGVGLPIPHLKHIHGATLKSGDTGEDVRSLQDGLARLGYNPPLTAQYDRETEIIVTAFQRHFRPRNVDGIADAETRTALNVVLAQVA
jgi:N-acetylmuramoyl-L-alanine amidase